MGTAKQTNKQTNVQGVTFDPSNFMDQIINTVDLNRSDIGSKPEEVIISTADVPNGERVESRLNAFYRLIGLPALRETSKIPNISSVTKDQLSQNRTLNYFHDTALEAEVKDALTKRESLLQAKKVEQDFVTMLKNPLPIGTSVSSNNNQSRRVSIFPLIVDASVPVYPLMKRVAPLFYDGDFILSGASNARLPRPFLESIVYMRTQVFSGLDTGTQNDIIANINAFVTKNVENTEASALTASLFAKGISFNILELQIINKMVQAIQNSAVKYRRAIMKAEDLNHEVRFVPKPRDTPNEKSGNSNFVDIESTDGSQSIEKKISSLELQLEQINLFISALPTEKVKNADITRRIDQDTVGLSNVTSDIFVSEFGGLIAFERAAIEKQLNEVKAERQNRLNQFEVIKKNIMYYSGEITGLSIFDVLCILLALFTIDISDLVALLNQEAQDRLSSSKFYSTSSDPALITVSKDTQDAIIAGNYKSVRLALSNLETKVREHFSLADAFYTLANKSGETKS